MGVKRARFTAYNTALQEGSFLYLDSDVIVLKPVSEFLQHGRITGCHDDLSEVSIIPDKRHPWVADFGLENRWFINSGVFFAPRRRRDFFAELLERSKNNELWEKYGILYDNSFLCAHFNLLNEEIDYVDSTVYNWQGLMSRGELQVERHGNSLVNIHTGKVLKIAHFAGVSDPDAAMCRWPAEVTSLLSAFGSLNEVSRERAFVDFLGTLNVDFEDRPKDLMPRRMLNALVRETINVTAASHNYELGDRDSYFSDPENMRSIAYAMPLTATRWNGLPCGGMWPDGDEYNLLLRLVRDLGLRTAVQLGTRETGMLLTDAGVQTLCLEWKKQPVPLRATDHGCHVAYLGLDEQTGNFEPRALKRAVEDIKSYSIDLLLIDFPETLAGMSMLPQLIESVQPKYIFLHDARRHAADVFSCQERFGLRLLAYHGSQRGAAVLAAASVANSQLTERFANPLDKTLHVTDPRIRIGIEDPRTTWSGDLRSISIRLTNLGHETLSSRYECPVLVSYHWLTNDHQTRFWDGLRTPLPFDVLPGCSATFRVNIAQEPECSLCCITLLQEHVHWFDKHDPANGLIVHLQGESVVPVEPAKIWETTSRAETSDEDLKSIAASA